MAIVFNDEGIMPGMNILSKSLGSYFDTRDKMRGEYQKTQKKQKASELISNWGANYNPDISPMENIGALSQALKESGVAEEGLPLIQDLIKKDVGQQGELFGAQQLLGNPPTKEQPEGEERPLLEDGVAHPSNPMQRFSQQDLSNLSASPNRIVSERAKAETEARKIDRQSFDADRKYHTQFAQKQEEKASALRESLPKKVSSLRHARNAINSGQVGAFSLNKLAEITGVQAFKTAKGSELVTAGKENLLSNMNRVSAKGQNIWFEQRLASMFPQVGTTEEANLAMQEMLESETFMDEAYLKKFDEIAAADEAQFGYSRKDVDRRARQSVEHLEDIAFNRSAYRIRQLEEREMGSTGMDKVTTKKVPSGTPLTISAGKLLLKKYGDPKKASDHARQLGYTIPDSQELKLYLMSPEEFSKTIRGL